MRKSIQRYFIIVVLITLMCTFLISLTLISKNMLATTKNDMLYSLKLIDYGLNYDEPFQEQIMELNPLAYSDKTRITVIDIYGHVLADTEDIDNMDNHIEREEIQQAIKEGIGYGQRRSDTTRFDTLYVALLSGEYIVRLSIPYSGIRDHLGLLAPGLTISIVVSFAVAVILSRNLSYRISKPIIEISDSLNEMTDDFRFNLKSYEYQEFNNIVDTIHNISHRLRKSLNDIKLEQNKMDAILKQMSEGFILLDENYKILSINEQATRLIGNLVVEDCILDHKIHSEIISALNNDISKQVIELKIQENIYAVYINKVDIGTTILFLDITISKEAEEMRREFFSNASHELKTPLTSIKGYSELLANGFITDENTQRHILNKMQDEVNNISSLINDFLLLSRIENMDVEEEVLPLDMKGVVLDVLSSYELLIDKDHIYIDVDIHDVSYIGNPRQMSTLMNNLIGNAIKYNKENGSVSIKITEEKNAIKIVVSDTGIGIPLKDQPRIFERFYRVDKGRSKQKGGTGLGLAIVKHIVNNNKGTIHLKSELDKGTTIEIILPQQEMNK